MSVLQRSITGAVLILAVLVLRALLARRLPRFTFMALWILAAVRLTVPFTLPSRFSLYSWLEGFGKPKAKTMLLLPQSAAVPAQGTSPIQTGLWIAWLIGAVLLAAYFGMSYCRCRRRFCASLPAQSIGVENWRKQVKSIRRINIRVSDQITSPLTYGILRPVILLPKNISWQDEAALGYVLSHEYVHIRRLDAAVKLLMAGALCVHWFNPLVWVMYFLANRDMELSCDEAVLSRSSQKEKAAYALALLQMEESRGASLYSHFSKNNCYFGKNAIEERICAIMKMKKFSAFVLVFALMLVLSVTAVFATSSINQSSVSDLPEGTVFQDEDGNSLPIGEGQLKAAGRFLQDEDGNLVLSPDDDLSALMDDGVEGPIVFAFDEDGNYGVYQYSLTDEENDWDFNIEGYKPKEYTDEEMAQIIADIESGKLKGFSVSELEEQGFRFVTYSENCYSGEDAAE